MTPARRARHSTFLCNGERKASARTVCFVINVDPEFKLLYGISFGSFDSFRNPDEDHSVAYH